MPSSRGRAFALLLLVSPIVATGGTLNVHPAAPAHDPDGRSTSRT
jgi:hypothetical protein